MSAGTVGFTDTRTDTNHIGSVISRILEARQLAEDERKYAEAQAKKNKTTLEEAGIKRGDFFKKALRWKFGGEFKQKKLSQLNTWKKRGSLLKGVATGNSKGNKLNRFERSQALFDIFKASDKPKTFRDKFKPLYQGFVKDPAVKPKSALVKPGTAKKIQKATTSKSNKRVSKEDILDSIAGITNAIEKIAESISEKNKIVSDQMIHSSVLQGMIHTQLKTNGDSLEEKLQKIVDAISNQTQYKKEAVDKAESRDAESKLEEQTDVASVRKFDNLLTKEDESIERPTGGYPELSQMGHAGMDLSGVGGKTPPMYMPPQAEQGAILSGPDSGYLVELHGKEKLSVEDKNVKVEPINNRYTRGQSSAVDGKVRPKPTKPIATPKSMPSNSIPKLEMGTDNKSPISSSPITSKFGFNTARNQMGIAGGGTTQQSKMTQTMVDLMSLPMTASGATMLASTTAYMQSLGKEGADIKPEIERIARPIAKTFGLPASIVNKAKQGSAGKSSGVGKSDGEDGESNKNILAKLMDGFGAMLDKMKDSINNDGDGGDGGGGGGGAAAENSMELIAGGEGGYNSINMGTAGDTPGGAKSVLGKNLTDMTVGQVMDAQANKGVHAVGKYQIIPDTMKGFVNTMKISKDDKFDEETQEKFKQYVSKHKRPIVGSFVEGKVGENKIDDVVMELAREFASVGVPYDTIGNKRQRIKKGQSFYSTEGGNRASINPDELKQQLLLDRKKFSEQTAQTPSPTSSPTVQLGHGITNNYGLKVGQERPFTVPGYGEVRARKTTTGFDFYRGGTILDVSPSNPQGKTIVDYFKSTNGGQTISRPDNSQKEKVISSLSSNNKSESGNIAMLNIGGGSQTSTAGSVPQPSGEDDTERGIHPLGPFGATSEYATIINNTG
jgi:hypothetical protein